MFRQALLARQKGFDLSLHREPLEPPPHVWKVLFVLALTVVVSVLSARRARRDWRSFVRRAERDARSEARTQGALVAGGYGRD